MGKRKKVLLCEFCQETNSFNPTLWGLDRFRSLLYTDGFATRAVFSLKRSPVMGMLEAARRYGARAVTGVALRSGSGGPVEDAVLELFLQKTLARIKRQGPFDGIFLSLHGATATPSYPDACGRAAEAVRAAAGPQAVICLCCDLHANITRTMSEAADFICGFQTYPHIDFYETGYRAAAMGLRRMAGEPLAAGYARVDMIVPASGYTSKSGAFREVLALGEAAQRRGEIADFSVFQMQPWLDVAEGASCAAVVAADREKADAAAKELARALYDRRAAFWPELMDVGEVLEIAACNETGRPVVLADAADSPNAGAPGDSVEAARRVLESGLAVRTLTAVADGEAARAAHAARTGAVLRLCLGGKYTPGLTPLEADFRVRSLHTGDFKLAGPAGKGMRIRMGRTAVLESGPVTVLVSGSPAMCGDLNFYRAFGLEPLDYALVVVKANTSFRENYGPIAAKICLADTPGAAGANLRALPYKNLPATFYPFCEHENGARKETP